MRYMRGLAVRGAVGGLGRWGLHRLAVRCAVGLGRWGLLEMVRLTLLHVEARGCALGGVHGDLGEMREKASSRRGEGMQGLRDRRVRTTHCDAACRGGEGGV